MNRLFSSWAIHLPKRGPRALLTAGFLAATLLFSTGSFALPAHAATPAALPGVPGSATFYYAGGGFYYDCIEGLSATTDPPPAQVQNGCTTRMWLYSNTDFTGLTLCVGPGETTGRLGTAWKSFRIVSNPDPCSATSAQPPEGPYLIFNQGGGGVFFDCAPGKSGELFPPLYAINDCGVRVWLYTNLDLTGLSLCVSPGEITGRFFTAWQSFRFVWNPLPCGE